MSEAEHIDETEKPPPLWWVPIFVGGFGWVLAAIGVFTHNRSIMAAAMVPLAIGGVVELIQFRRGDFSGPSVGSEPATAPATPPLPATPMPVGTSLVGVRIRHRDGISTVTEDLDTPMPRRTVAAVDAHGRPENLSVSVDEAGNVIEAAVPGAEWAAAEAI